MEGSTTVAYAGSAVSDLRLSWRHRVGFASSGAAAASFGFCCLCASAPADSEAALRYGFGFCGSACAGSAASSTSFRALRLVGFRCLALGLVRAQLLPLVLLPRSRSRWRFSWLRRICVVDGAFSTKASMATQSFCLPADTPSLEHSRVDWLQAFLKVALVLVTNTCHRHKALEPVFDGA